MVIGLGFFGEEVGNDLFVLLILGVFGFLKVLWLLDIDVKIMLIFGDL